MRPRFLFVTGTDTGVGKTTLCRALLAAWRRQGRAVAPLKPIETGCGPNLQADDAARLAHAAGTDPARSCLSRFIPPLCPEAAARELGQVLFVPHLLWECERAGAGLVLVEGAGGLLVPIAPGYTMADLAQSLSASVLIVARSRLGTINHTLLTVMECRRRKLPVIGVILNRVDPDRSPDEPMNAELIAQHGNVPVLSTFPHADAADGAADDEQLADLAQAHLPLDLIWHAPGW